MPQLDKVSFLSQFFWLCVFFFTFYIASLKFFIPEMSRILKYRKLRLNESHQGVTDINQEKVKLADSADAVIENALKSGKSSFKDMLQTTESWLSNFVDQTNRTKFLHTNSSYLSSVGKTSLSHSISVQGIFTNVSTKIFLHSLIQRMNSASLQKKTFVSKSSSKTNNSRNKISIKKRLGNNLGGKRLDAESKADKKSNLTNAAYQASRQTTSQQKKESKKVGKNKK